MYNLPVQYSRAYVYFVYLAISAAQKNDKQYKKPYKVIKHSIYRNARYYDFEAKLAMCFSASLGYVVCIQFEHTKLATSSIHFHASNITIKHITLNLITTISRFCYVFHLIHFSYAMLFLIVGGVSRPSPETEAAALNFGQHLNFLGFVCCEAS